MCIKCIHLQFMEVCANKKSTNHLSKGHRFVRDDRSVEIRLRRDRIARLVSLLYTNHLGHECL